MTQVALPRQEPSWADQGHSNREYLTTAVGAPSEHRKRDCPICGSPKVETVLSGRDRIFLQPGDYEVVRCGSCRVLFTWPWPRDTMSCYPQDYFAHVDYTLPETQDRGMRGVKSELRRLARIYHFGYGTPAGGVRGAFEWLISYPLRGRAEGWFGSLPKHVKGGRVLDVGCGSGHWLACLSQLGTWELWGVEPSALGCETARKHGIDHVMESDLSGAGLPENNFDVVRIWHVLEHTHSPREVLDEAYRVLKPGGLLIVGVPNGGSVMFRLFGTYWFHLDLPRHLFHFSKPVLIRLVRDIGFRIVSFASRPQGRSSLFTSLCLLMNERNRNGRFQPDVQLPGERFLQRSLMVFFWGLDRLGLGDTVELRAYKPFGAK